MGSFKTLASVYLLLVGLGVPQAAMSQTRQVSGVVETLDGKRLPHVTIRITNVGGTTTSDSGEFAFQALNVAPGQAILLTLENDWVISSPWEGRTFVPMLATDPILVRVAHRGDPRLLADPDVVKNIVVGVTSQLAPLLTSGGGTPQGAAATNDYLASKANDLGLTVEQIKSAIDQWIAGVQGPYQEGLAAFYAGRFQTASQLLRQSIDASEPELSLKYRILASAEMAEGHYPDAESAVRKALALHPEQSESLIILGSVLANEDRFTEATATLESALEIDRRSFDRKSPAIATVLCDLGAAYSMGGRFSDAQSALEDGLAIIDHNDGNLLAVGICLNNLSDVLRREGKYPEAEHAAQRTMSLENLQAAASKLKPTAPLVNLGLIYKDTGRYREALDLLNNAIAIDEKQLEPSHPEVVRELLDRASVYAEENDFASAQQDLEQARSLSEGAGRTDSVEFAMILCGLGQVYDSGSRFSEAQSLLQRALDIAQAKLGPENYRVAIVLRTFGLLYVDEKDFTEAENLLRKALAMDAKFLGPDNPSTAEDHNFLGFYNSSRGFDAAAESEYLLAYTSLLKTKGPTDPEVGQIADSIAIALRKEGKNAEAVQYESLAAKAGAASNNGLPDKTGKP
jgi:tetratricopeptide (TPR) repeat protein